VIDSLYQLKKINYSRIWTYNLVFAVINLIATYKKY